MTIIFQEIFKFDIFNRFPLPVSFPQTSNLPIIAMLEAPKNTFHFDPMAYQHNGYKCGPSPKESTPSSRKPLQSYKKKATLIAMAIRVIIPGAACFTSDQKPFRKGQLHKKYKC